MTDPNALFLAGLERYHNDRLQEVFNPQRPELSPTSVQQDILKDQKHNVIHVLGGNRSGKSQLGGRITSWWFNNAHPYMKRPKDWGSGPLTIIVIGRVTEQIESELYVNKIKPFLVEGDYREVRSGGFLQRIEHRHNKNRILFFSHHNINEAREKIQAFTAHFIWLDEMADSASFIYELITRCVTTSGRMLCTFTPLVRSDEVRRLVDGATGVAKKYKLSMMDNPVIAEDPKKQAMILELYKDMSEAERNTRLFGDWFVGEKAVYEFNSDRHVETPDGYSQIWRHVLSVDPAASGTTGFTLWAEHPKNGTWYCVEASYIKGLQSPADIVEAIESKVQHLNIVRRVSDPHETWFIGQAASRSPKALYTGVYKKNDRKIELIKNLQLALSSGNVKLTHNAVALVDEFTSCQWSESSATPRIINASRYHLLDAAQYFVDNRPKFVANQPLDNLQSFEARLRQQHKEQRKLKNLKIQRRGKRRWRR